MTSNEEENDHYIKTGAEIALKHHEDWNSGVYPNGKSGESIPLAVRIMNICVTCDAQAKYMESAAGFLAKQEC